MPDNDLRPSVPPVRGTVIRVEHESGLLAGNPLADPARRHVHLYLPPGYDDGSRHYPVLWCLAAYTSAGPAQVAWRNHGENVPERLDRLIHEKRMPPVICVFPDCYTTLGGNQYVNSPALGPYADYLVDELVPWVDGNFRTIPEPAARAVFGKSSGGFGALHLAMSHPGTWAAVASHAGDCGFDRVYLRDFPLCCDALSIYDGDVEAFVRAFWRQRRTDPNAFHAMMVLCLAASYSPDASMPLGLKLPFDPVTCRLREPVWERWLAFDPVCRVSSHIDELGALAGLWIDAGNRDQYFIHYGTRELHEVLESCAIAHRYEEFDGDHSNMDWRLDYSLPWVAARLKPD